MAIRNPLALNRNLSVILQSGQTATGTPYAARISLVKLSTYLIGATVAYLTLFIGTLLFFRELELNRKLQENVLRLETERRLYQAYPLPDRMLTEAVTQNAIPDRVPTASLPAAAPGEKAKSVRTLEEVFGRINDLRVECGEDNCAVKLGMVTTQPGTAVGKLVLVLETEVPRIGGSNPSTPMRKRFFLYPGGNAVDELDPNQLGTLEQKAFRFTHALQTAHVFKMGKLLRPLAVNAYIFDPEKTLLQHERRVIEAEE